MKKRLLGLILVLCLVVPVLSGCSLYSKDAKKIEEQVAIYVGDEVITKQEIQNMYTTYYNYGYGYIYDQEELMDIVVRTLVNQKIALVDAKQSVNITEEDFDNIITSIGDALKSAIDERERAIFNRMDEEIPERICSSGTSCTIESHKHEKAEETESYQPYTFKKVEPIQKKAGTQISESVKAEKVATFVEELKSGCKQYATRLAAFNEYVAELVQVEAIDGKTANKDQALGNKIDEMIKYYEEQKYLEKYQEYVESQVEIDDKEVLKKYIDLVNIEKQTYAGDNFATSYENSTSKSTFLYYGYQNKNDKDEDVENGYIHVQHLLVQFSDETKAELAKLPGYGMSEKEYRFHLGEQWLETPGNTKENAPAYCWFPETEEEKNQTAGFISYEAWVEYCTIRESFVGDMKNTYKKEGENEFLSVNEFLTEIGDLMNGLSDVEKAKKFRELMHDYGEDPGMFQEGYTTEVIGYSLPADMSKFSNDIKNNASGFVGEFVVGAYELAESGNLIGSAWVVTDHGVHLMLNLGATQPGEVWKMELEGTPVEFTKSAIDKLSDEEVGKLVASMNETYISLSYGQSVYAYVYEQMIADKQSTAYSDKLAQLKAEVKVEYKLSTYKQIFG